MTNIHLAGIALVVYNIYTTWAVDEVISKRTIHIVEHREGIPTIYIEVVCVNREDLRSRTKISYRNSAILNKE